MSHLNVVAEAFHAIAANEEGYKEGIKKNVADSMGFAGRLNKDRGEVVEILNNLSNKDNISFLEEQRVRLIRLAEKNVENERTVDVFIAAAKSLKQSTLASNEEVEDYCVVVEEAMDKERQSRQAQLLPMEQEKVVRDMKSELGEKNAASKDDDDEIEFVGGGASQTQSLKCSITGTFLENPMRNKLCKHTYSLEGIKGLIAQAKRIRKACACPVTGCSNGNVTMEQLEQDLVLERQVARAKRKQEMESQRLQSQANEIESDEEEF